MGKQAASRKRRTKPNASQGEHRDRPCLVVKMSRPIAVVISGGHVYAPGSQFFQAWQATPAAAAHLTRSKAATGAARAFV